MLFLLLACAVDEEPEPVTIEVCGEVVTLNNCDHGIREVFPADGAVNVYYRDRLEWQMTDADAQAVGCIEGVDGQMSMNEDGDAVFFQPDEPLDALATYTASFGYCRGRVDTTFTVGDYGQPVQVDALEGRVFMLSVLQARVLRPEGIGSLLEPYLSEAENQVMFGVVQADSTLTMRGAVPNDDGAQDTCQVTYELPTADFSENPYFQIGPTPLEIDAGDVVLSIDEVMLSGDFTPQADAFTGGRLTGLLDARALAGLVDGYEDPQGICDLIAGFGVPCEPCGDDEVFCLTLDVAGLSGDLVGTDGLEEISVQDCHQDCPDTWNEDGSLANPECTL